MRCPVTRLEMLSLGLGYEKYRDKEDAESMADFDKDADTFYVWRL